MSLTSVDVVPSATSGPSLSELISQASVAAVSFSMSHLVFKASVAVTTSPVSTPLSSSVAPTSLFDSPIGIFLHLKRRCLQFPLLTRQPMPEIPP
ncbi:hypothetical protein Hanom_Chr17g01549231 [Helianthus anomalus]